MSRPRLLEIVSLARDIPAHGLKAGAEGTVLAGVHIELTGEDVTECTGGARGISDDDLSRAYRSQVDPRLNYEQALELAMLIARV